MRLSIQLKKQKASHAQDIGRLISEVYGIIDTSHHAK